MRHWRWLCPCPGGRRILADLGWHRILPAGAECSSSRAPAAHLQEELVGTDPPIARKQTLLSEGCLALQRQSGVSKQVQAVVWPQVQAIWNAV